MTTQIAVKLPDALLARIDDLVEDGTFESRSDAVRVGLGLIAKQAMDEAVDQAFRQGFTEHPDTPEDLAVSTRAAIELIEEEPWDPWW